MKTTKQKVANPGVSSETSQTPNREVTVEERKALRDAEPYGTRAVRDSNYDRVCLGLEDRGLLEQRALITNSSRAYMITEKGRQVLEQRNPVVEVSDDGNLWCRSCGEFCNAEHSRVHGFVEDS